MPIRLTRAVKALVIACFAAFVVQKTADMFFDGNLLQWFGLVPSSFVFNLRLWQLFTYSFLHGDVMHLFLNLMMLVFIGGELEAVWGTYRFLRFYFLCVVSAGLLYLVLQMFVWGGEGLQTPMIGASGGIYGLLMAYGLIFGERVLLFMMLFPMKAKHFVWVLALIEFMTSLYSGRGGLASAAHLGGMFTGFSYLWIRASIQVSKKRRQLRSLDKQKVKPRRKKSGHLKLVINNNNDKELRKLLDEEDVDDGPKTWH